MRLRKEETEKSYQIEGQLFQLPPCEQVELESKHNFTKNKYQNRISSVTRPEVNRVSFICRKKNSSTGIESRYGHSGFDLRQR